jgi:hypothetical protein
MGGGGLRHYTISRKVVGSILFHVIEFFNFPIFPAALGLGTDSASNKNEYQESSYEQKVAGA